MVYKRYELYLISSQVIRTWLLLIISFFAPWFWLACGEAMDKNGSSEEEVDVNNNFIDPQAEDRELKGQLLRKYSGYLGSLKQEFMKKRKKGKLPKEARQQLLDWWSRHYKWPYPSVIDVNFYLSINIYIYREIWISEFSSKMF